MSRVHLRRALLLFAIVLGVAALVASLSPPLEERRGDTTPSKPVLQACLNISGPSTSKLSLN